MKESVLLNTLLNSLWKKSVAVQSTHQTENSVPIAKPVALLTYLPRPSLVPRLSILRAWYTLTTHACIFPNIPGKLQSFPVSQTQPTSLRMKQLASSALDIQHCFLGFVET